MSTTPEGYVKSRVKRLLKALRAWYCMPVGHLYGRHGVPDIIACLPVTITPDMVGQTVGLFVAIETKAPGKRENVTPNQQRELESVRAASGVAVVVESDAELCEVLHHLLVDS